MKKDQRVSYVVANHILPKGTETQHIACFGSPGSGKTTCTKELLDQIREKGQRAVVFDPSGEYIETYFRPGKDVILNPLDDRMPQWHPWMEIRSSEDYETISSSLFPPDTGKDPFWANAGSTIFSELLEKLDTPASRSNNKLYRIISESTVEAMHSWLSGTPAEKFLSPDSGGMAPGVLATVMAKTKAWRFLPDRKTAAPFSIREFVQNESTDSWLFLSMRADQEAVLRPMVSLWCDLVANSVLSLKPDAKRRFWIILDELSTLQRLTVLEPLLAKARKYGAPVVLGLQSISQLRSIYGRDLAAALVSQPQTWLVLRSVEPETAEWLERALGKFDADEIRQSISMGANSQRDGVSLQEQRRTESIAMATEITSLPDLEGYLKISGQKTVHYVKFDWKDRPVRNIAGFVPAIASSPAEKITA